MIHKRISLLVCSLYQITAFAQQINHVITFFVQDLPLAAYSQEELDRLGMVNNVTKKIIKNQLKPIVNNNVFATYMGYLSITDELNQITFPRKTEQPELFILITQQINQVMMVGNTIAYWQIAPNTPAKMLHAVREKYPNSNVYYWNITYATPPKKGIVPLQTIVIFANPEEVLLPTGTYLTMNSPHLILPDVYVKKGYDGLSNALFVLTIKQFFGPVTKSIFKQQKDFAGLLAS